MSPVQTGDLLVAFLIFCRIGGCLMVAPGFSSNRIPVRVRLYIAIGLSVACTPMLLPVFPTDIDQRSISALVSMIAAELLTGVLVGTLGRVIFFGLQTLLNAAAMAVGFGGIPGAPVDDAEAIPPVSSLLMLAATALVFILDLHLEIMAAMIASYEAIAPGAWLGAKFSLMKLVDQTTAGFLLALRVCAPFLVYSILINLAVGFANKMTPQIPAFFIATPFIMFGGLIMFYFLSPELLSLFMDGFRLGLKQDGAL